MNTNHGALWAEQLCGFFLKFTIKFRDESTNAVIVGVNSKPFLGISSGMFERFCKTHYDGAPSRFTP